MQNRRGRRVLQAAGERQRLSAVLDDFLHHGVGADGIAGEDQEGIVALRQQALEQLALLREFPLLRHAIVGAADAEVLDGVRAGLFPGREVGVRPARHQCHLGVRPRMSKSDRKAKPGGR